MNDLIVISSRECVEPLAPILDSLFDWMLFDHIKGDGATISCDGISFSISCESSAQFDQFRSILFYPDSVERFLLNSDNQLSKSTLSKRSHLAFRLGLLLSLSEKKYARANLGNIPIHALTASNRISLRSNAKSKHLSQWAYFSDSNQAKDNYSGPQVFRFLPDSHIREGNQVTVPFSINKKTFSFLSNVDFPFGVEDKIACDYDIRSFVFGSTRISYFWKRARSEDILDVRLCAAPLGEVAVEDEDALREIDNAIDDFSLRYQLTFFCVDFVSNMRDIYVPVDLNVTPTWNWFASDTVKEINKKFRDFISEQFDTLSHEVPTIPL